MVRLAASEALPDGDHVHLLTGRRNPSPPLPSMVGMERTTEPVEIEFARGENTLVFSRGHFVMRGVTIKDCTPSPVTCPT